MQQKDQTSTTKIYFYDNFDDSNKGFRLDNESHNEDKNRKF